MELDVYTTTVELLDIPSYTTNITIEGQLLRLHFLWNERIGKRTLFITNTNEESYLQNTILHPNEPFELNSNAVYDELPYSVVLQKVGNVNRIGNILNWSKDYVLCFYRTVDTPPVKLNVTYGVTVPSTPILPPPRPSTPPVEPPQTEDSIPSSVILPLSSGGKYKIEDGEEFYQRIVRHLVDDGADVAYFTGLSFTRVTGDRNDPMTVRITNTSQEAKRISITAIDGTFLDKEYFSSKNLDYDTTVELHKVVSENGGEIFSFLLGAG